LRTSQINLQTGKLNQPYAEISLVVKTYKFVSVAGISEKPDEV
jgi:hypothetical protein